MPSGLILREGKILPTTPSDRVWAASQRTAGRGQDNLSLGWEPIHQGG